MDYEKLTHVMRELALVAGDKIMEIYGRDDFEVKSKSDDSPVTEADEAADAIISAGLRSAFPDVLLITEEQAATHDMQADTFLIVDPLGRNQGICTSPRRFYCEYRLCRKWCADPWSCLCARKRADVLYACGRQRCGRRRAV